MVPDLPRPQWLLLACLLAMLPFAGFPVIDTWVSALFFDGKAWLGGPASETLRFALWRLSGLVLFAAFVLWIMALVRRRAVLRGTARVWGFVVLTYALGPGLMADTLLKRFWGRARPADVAEFGGSLRFTPPWQPTDQCLSNCSFVSGEVSGATATAIGLMVLIGLWRDRLGPLQARVLAGIALALPLVSAAQRITSGRHFLSDAVFAVLFTLLVASLLRAALFGRQSPAPRAPQTGR